MANKLRAKRLKLRCRVSIPANSPDPRTLLLGSHYIVSFPFSISISFLKASNSEGMLALWMLIWILHIFPFTSLIHFVPIKFVLFPSPCLSLYLSAALILWRFIERFFFFSFFPLYCIFILFLMLMMVILLVLLMMVDPLSLMVKESFCSLVPFIIPEVPQRYICIYIKQSFWFV